MKRDKIIFWSATVFIFLFEAVMPLSSVIFVPDQFNVGTNPLGYPDYFAYALMVCKVLGATALVIPSLHPKIREWAYAGLTFNLIFAALSHLVVDGNIGFILLPIIIGVILAVSYIYNQKVNRHLIAQLWCSKNILAEVKKYLLMILRNNIFSADYLRRINFSVGMSSSSPTK